MESKEARAVYDRYLGAWNTNDMSKRLEIANSVLSDDVEYLTKSHDLSHGRALILEDMTRFHKNFPGGHFEIGGVSAHHNVGLVTWVIVKADGEEAARGPDQITVDGDGRISKITTFPPLQE